MTTYEKQTKTRDRPLHGAPRRALDLLGALTLREIRSSYSRKLLLIKLLLLSYSSTGALVVDVLP